jgi:uncharacterized protein YneF (UPF0154 family)
MDWLVGILLLAVGIVIGFFVAKYVKKEQSNKTDADSNEQTIKELMMQQASHHLLETKQITEQLAAQTSALKNQIDSYEQLLISQNTPVLIYVTKAQPQHGVNLVLNFSPWTSPHKARDYFPVTKKW